MTHMKNAVGIPKVRDRSEEVLWWSTAALFMLASTVFALYIWLRLQLLDAMWMMLPMVLISSLFAWPAMAARRKRLKAAKEFERYRAGVRKAAEEI